MAGKIPRPFIDDLLARTDIVEIIDSRVKLRKAGKNYQACCPFHNEKSPSFSVSPDKQFYHCFGCGVHGNAISFLMEYDQLEFPEAIEELAGLYGLDVPREDTHIRSSHHPKTDKQQQQNDYDVMEQIAKFFAHQLKHHSNGAKAIEYLKARGLSGEIVKDFGIGYAPTDWDAVAKQFGVSDSQLQQLQDLQLIRKSERGSYYDFFRDRVMFPIKNSRDKVIGFGGRVIDSDGPKYLNSPETRIFHKGQELYALQRVKKLNRKLDHIVIVEGYMDVVALAQYDVNYAVASLGTATTSDHIQKLFRSCSQVVCCFDGDRAGREAAWRTLEVALPKLKDGYELKFLFLPDGEDPDTLVRKEGKAGFEQRLTEAQALSDFLFERLRQQYPGRTDESKAALLAFAQPLITQIPGEQLNELLLNRLFRITGQKEKEHEQNNKQAAKGAATIKSAKQDWSQPKKVTNTPMRMLVRLLISYPMLATNDNSVNPHTLSRLNIRGHELFAQLHQLCVQSTTITPAQIFEHFRTTSFAKSIVLLMNNNEEVFNHENALELYKDTYKSLIKQSLDLRIEELTARATHLNQQEKLELKSLIKTKSGL